MRSTSPIDILCGSQITPPLAPPKGMLTTAHFQVIQLARARTSSSVTSGEYRMPPLAGPRAIECCTRKPVKTSIRPSSMDTGMWTMISRWGYRRIFHRPSSRFSFCAAKSNRAACASQGFSSCSSDTVFICAPTNLRQTEKYRYGQPDKAIRRNRKSIQRQVLLRTSKESPPRERAVFLDHYSCSQAKLSSLRGVSHFMQLFLIWNHHLILEYHSKYSGRFRRFQPEAQGPIPAARLPSMSIRCARLTH